MFSITLSVNDKYPFRDLENFLWPTQLQLSLKPKTLSDFFNPFLGSISNFKQFEKKDDGHSYFITEITGCERFGWTTL